MKIDEMFPRRGDSFKVTVPSTAKASKTSTPRKGKRGDKMKKIVKKKRKKKK